VTPLRIGVNALYLLPGGVGGTEIYLRQLLRSMAEIPHPHHVVVFTNRETGRDLVPDREHFEYCPQPVQAANRPARILFEQFRLPGVLRRTQIDVLLNPGFTGPIRTPIPSVTVFHDLQHIRHPEYFSRLDLPFWKFFLWQSAKRSARLIAVSKATQQDVMDHYHVSPKVISVIPHGVEPEFFSLLGPRNTAEPYILCVSTLHPHKNLERLVRVFAKLRSERPDLWLVLAGMRGFHAQEIDRVIAETNLGESVKVTGWIPRQQLYSLFQHAAAFVYPSTFEGFGMPVLEAMAAGLPVACSDIPPLREVAEGAVLFFQPEQDDDLLAALKSLLDDQPLAARLSAAGPVRARAFTWEEAARKTLASLEAAAGVLKKQP
jgi:glycosyltransferase involved in cell wall biosynthesis